MMRGALGSMPCVFLTTPCEDVISIESKETVTKNPALTTFAPSQQMKSVGTVQLCGNCPEWKKVKCRHSQNEVCRQGVGIVFAPNISTIQAAPAPVLCRQTTSRSDIVTNGRDEAIEPSSTSAGRKKGSRLASNGRAPEPLRGGVQSLVYPHIDARLPTIITTVARVMPSLSDENRTETR